MERKVAILSICTALLLILSFYPSAAIEITKENEVVEMENSESELISLMEPETVKYNIYHIKEDKNYNKMMKELTVTEAEAMWEELESMDFKDKNITEIYEEKLEIMKSYELLPSDTTLADILDITKLEEEKNEAQNGYFEAAFAPILFVGGGFGIGLGVPFLLTSGVFIMILFGFGMVLCYDPVNGVLNNLSTLFFIPMLIGYLGGFTGLLLLPVIPGVFYSNALGLGLAAVTIWSLVPNLS